MERTYAGTIRREHTGQQVTLAGWVQKQRDFGELIFIDVRDRSGVVQVIVDRARGASDEVVAAAKEARSEFVIRVEGKVFERDEQSRNARIATGDVEVLATGLEILNRSETPPFAIDDEVEAAEELRLQYRYLDLRRSMLTRNLTLR